MWHNYRAACIYVVLSLAFVHLYLQSLNWIVTGFSIVVVRVVVVVAVLLVVVVIVAVVAVVVTPKCVGGKLYQMHFMAVSGDTTSE